MGQRDAEVCEKKNALVSSLYPGEGGGLGLCMLYAVSLLKLLEERAKGSSSPVYLSCTILVLVLCCCMELAGR
jgi:hypothetical protein